MPLHSLQRLSPTALLGLWHLTEAPADLWPLLPAATQYAAHQPTTPHPDRLAQWLAGRILVHTLARSLGLSTDQLQLHNEVTGRPWLAGAPSGTVVSLSHSGEWVAALLSTDGRVGVDVEIIRDKARRVATKFLNPTELEITASIAEASLTKCFSLLWSAKETLYKLAAQPGIIFREQLLLDNFALADSGEIRATLRLAGSATRHRICYTQPAPGYILTYCYSPALPSTASC